MAFLSTIQSPEHVDYAIDINPHKQGMYLPGTGHRVRSPHELRDRSPDVIIAMNPIYLPEIQRLLSEMQLDARLSALGDL